MKRSKPLRYFGIALLVLGVSIIAFLIWQQTQLDAFDYMQKHNIRTPADLTERHFGKLFPNIPKEYRAEIIERLDALVQEAGEDGWRIAREATFWFKDYPPVYDPKNKAEYWEKAARELCEYLEDRTEFYRTKTVQQEDEYYERHFVYQLSDRRKENLRTGFPLYINPKLGTFRSHSVYWGTASWNHSANPAQAFMFERRNEELALLKVNATPNLVEQNLTVGDIERWDGSTSLQPVVRIITAHAAGIPWKWRLPGGYHQRDGSEIVLTDHYSWAVDDEVGSEPTEGPGSYNRLFANRPSYDFSSPNSTDQPPTFDKDAKPTAHFLNNFKFNQTHGAFVNVIESNRDLVFATRRPSPDELKLAKERNVELECTPFARDAFVFIVNRHNPVRNLTLQQVRDIFAGKVTRWKDVGGVAGTVRPLIRDRNSGSEELMRELVMKDVPVPANFKHQLISGMSGLFDVLEKDMEGIGYTILYYDRYMVCNPHTRVLKIDGIEPTPQTIADGTYRLLYECVAVTRKGGPKRAQAIVDWLISAEGQAVVRETGYSGYFGAGQH